MQEFSHKEKRGKQKENLNSNSLIMQWEDFTTNPGDSWQMIFKLIKGIQGHHQSFCQKNSKAKKEKWQQHYKEVSTA